jgi:hypothetical protein
VAGPTLSPLHHIRKCLLSARLPEQSGERGDPRLKLAAQPDRMLDEFALILTGYVAKHRRERSDGCEMRLFICERPGAAKPARMHGKVR